MFSRTDGNCARDFTLGSQDFLSTSLASSSPLSSEWLCIQRSASTISAGYVAAARICATSASGYKAIGATSCCNSCAVCCTGCVGACVCVLDWPVKPKDSASVVNCTSKQQRSKVKICLTNFMAYSPVQKNHIFLIVKSESNQFREPSSARRANLLPA